MSIVEFSMPNPNDNKKKLGSIEKKVNDLANASINSPTKAAKEPISKNHYWQKPAIIIAWFFAISYFFLKFGFTGVDLIANLLVTVFSFLKVSMVWGLIDGESWVALMSMYVVFMLYFDIFLLFPFTYILSVRKDPVERIMKQINWEVVGLVILLVPLLTTSLFYFVFGTDDDIRAQNVENFQVDSKNKWEQLVEGPLCPLIHLGNPQVCLETTEPIQAVKTTRVEYEIYFKKPDFTYVEDLERWKQRPFYLNYEIQAKGEPIYLERIECYQNKVDKENLLSNISLENQKILSDDRTAIRGAQCDLAKAKTDDFIQKDYKLITLLYYNFEATYTQPVPVYDMDLYIENKFGTKEGVNIISEEASIREDTKNDIKPIIPNDALGLTTYAAPSLPVFLGEDYQDRNQYTLTFTFEKKSSSDTLVSSEITDFKLPSMFVQNCVDYDCESIEGPLVTYDDKSQIIVDFEVEDEGLERESYTQNIEFDVKSRYYSRDTITLTVNNPDWTEETTTATPDVEVTTPESGSESEPEQVAQADTSDEMPPAMG